MTSSPFSTLSNAVSLVSPSIFLPDYDAAKTEARTSLNPETEAQAQKNLSSIEGFEAKTSWLRWPLLFFFVNCIMIVSAFSLALAPASPFLATAYSVSIVEVNMCGIAFTATFVPMTFASMWMYKALKTDTVLRIACFIILVGGWMRMLAADG